jgi:hypothetical protein
MRLTWLSAPERARSRRFDLTIEHKGRVRPFSQRSVNIKQKENPMWMNQYEIDAAAHAFHECPNVRKGVALLKALAESVNQQSDGWAYWRAPSKAAEKLMQLLQTAGNLSYGTHASITEADLAL